MSDALKAREAQARLRENLASFDAEVAYELASGGERADLWGEIDVNVEDLRAALSALDQPSGVRVLDVDDLAQEIRRVDGENSLGAGALAEALMPFLSALDLSAIGAEGWRSMDSAPKDGRSRILAIDAKGRQFVAWWRGIDHKPHEDKPDWYISGTLIAAPTLVAWMPLPTPLPSPPEPRS